MSERDERPRGAWDGRGEGDLSNLVLELARTWKGLRMTPAGHPARRDVLDRGYLAWKVDLERSGPLCLRWDPEGFHAVGVGAVVPRSLCPELAESLEAAGLAGVDVSPGLDRQAFRAWLELLSTDERFLARGGGFATLFAENGGAGLQPVFADSGCPTAEPAPGARAAAAPPSVGADPAPPPSPSVPSQPESGAPALSGPGPGLRLAPTPGPSPEPGPSVRRSASPPLRTGADPVSEASLGSALLGGGGEPFAAEPVRDPYAIESLADALEGAGPPPGPAPPDPGHAAPRSVGPGDPDESAGRVGADDDATLPLAPSAEATFGPGLEDFTKPCLEEDPLAAAAVDPGDETMLELVRELDACVDDESYAALAEAVADEARRACDPDPLQATYRAVLVLADHAVGIGGRSGRQVLAAQSRLEALCTGAVLEDLIGRACDPEGRISVRAAQVLLQLAGRAVAPLLDRLVHERDEQRRARITAILIALGDRAVPIVVAAIRAEGVPPARVRVAIRLAGELQSDHLAPTLESVIETGSPDLRREALRALGRLASDRALSILYRGLSSGRPGVPEAAAAAIGEVGRASSARPLMARLDAAVADGDTAIAVPLVSALGRLGCEEAVPKLVALLERRTWLRRSRARSLRAPALEALARLPGREARRTLERVAAGRDPELGPRARSLLGLAREPGPVAAEAGRDGSDR